MANTRIMMKALDFQGKVMPDVSTIPLILFAPRASNLGCGRWCLWFVAGGIVGHPGELPRHPNLVSLCLPFRRDDQSRMSQASVLAQLDILKINALNRPATECWRLKRASNL